MGLALDLSRGQPEPSVAHVHGLRAVGADIQTGPHRAGRVADRESLAPWTDGEPHRLPGPEVCKVEQLHFVGTQGISRPPARRLAARAITKSRSESRFMYASTSWGTGALSASSTSFRSARRQTVRQRCNAAPAREPPGRMKFFIGGSCSGGGAVSFSRRSTCCGA